MASPLSTALAAAFCSLLAIDLQDRPDPEVVYHSFRNGNFTSTLFAVDLDRKGERKVSTHAKGRPTCMDPAVSPDGKQIAFTRGSSSGSHRCALWIMDADGSNERKLSEGRTRRFDHGRVAPSWSPDGRWIVYVENSHGSADLFVIGSDGQGRRKLTDNDRENVRPVWSPEGDWIAYTSVDDRALSLRLVRPDGSEDRPLGGASGEAWDPTWSPDGNQLAFSAVQNGQVDLFVADLEGEIVARLTDSTDSEAQAAWSPDGRWIAYAGRPASRPKEWRRDIYVVAADLDTEDSEREIRQLTDNAFPNEMPSWLPGHR